MINTWDKTKYILRGMISMKKVIIVGLLAAMVVFTACGKTDENEVFNGDININNIEDIVKDSGKNNAKNDIGEFVAPDLNDLGWTKTEDGTGIIITSYSGTEKALALPDELEGLPVVEIGKSAFAFRGIAGIKLPDTVKILGEAAFEGTGLVGIDLPAGLEEIGERAFSMSTFKNITLPEGLKVLGDGAFVMSDIEEIVIPGTVETIGKQAFSTCNSLKKVEIKDGVKVIDDKAFEYCEALESVYVPASVEAIEYSVFWGTPENCTLYIPDGCAAAELYYEEEGGVLLQK